MNCWYCGHELIWISDYDIEDESEDYAIVSHLSCPKCDAFVEVYKSKEKDAQWEGSTH